MALKAVCRDLGLQYTLNDKQVNAIDLLVKQQDVFWV
jgi:hypothetical protein